jgi:hypothetical protein
MAHSRFGNAARQPLGSMGAVLRTTSSAAVVLFLFLSQAPLWPQTAVPDSQSGPAQEQQAQQSGSTGASETAAPVAAPAAKNTDSSEGKQTKRIFWIVPNYAAVSAHTQLPPLSAHDKFALAMHDSVDYSSFVWAGVLAGQSMALKAYPELHQGAAGYRRYYWRAFADQASGAFFTEAIVPAMTHEDPHYYTLGEGSFLRRTAYALSQVVRTKTDSGGTSFNFSEVLGNGMEAGLSNLYYPPQERGLRKTGENWATGLESAALNNIIKEFWPDIRHNLLRQK